MKTINKIFLMSFFSFIAMSGLAMGEGSADLDDGISKFTDDGIEKDGDLGKPDQNIKFIVMNAKAKANTIKDSREGAVGKSGGANMNSVVLGAGANVKGPIYIIDQSKGSKTNISE